MLSEAVSTVAVGHPGHCLYVLWRGRKGSFLRGAAVNESHCPPALAKCTIHGRFHMQWKDFLRVGVLKP